MLERVRGSDGRMLDGVGAYFNDADQYWEHISMFTKLERLQHFEEPDNESWRAFAEGDWKEAQNIRLRNRHKIVDEFAEDARRGITSRRVRIVELPVTPYLHWELYGLKIRAECGEQIRVVSADKVAQFESTDPIPELVFMGSRVLFEVRYDSLGILRGARKITDAKLIEGCLNDVNLLYRQGEDLHMFFDREIAHLPPPKP